MTGSNLLFLAAWLLSPAVHAQRDLVVEKDVLIPARDRVQLATDIYRPAPAVPSGFPCFSSELPTTRTGSGSSRRRASSRATATSSQSRTSGDGTPPGASSRNPTANVFQKGHRIRIDISSSNFPRFDVSPNTGEPLGRSRNRIVAENTVYHERSRASYVVLPIVPAGSSSNE